MLETINTNYEIYTVIICSLAIFISPILYGEPEKRPCIRYFGSGIGDES